jgi:hypothetical protein
MYLVNWAAGFFFDAVTKCPFVCAKKSWTDRHIQQVSRRSQHNAKFTRWEHAASHTLEGNVPEMMGRNRWPIGPTCKRFSRAAHIEPGRG